MVISRVAGRAARLCSGSVSTVMCLKAGMTSLTGSSSFSLPSWISSIAAIAVIGFVIE